MKNLYPFFFNPIYKQPIWGGKNLERIFNRTLPSDVIGESWELCCHKNGTSIINNGFLQGNPLSDVIQKDKVNILGSRCLKLDRFPILLKFIDANDKLSVQVHPDNSYAMSVEKDWGKTEMWYVIDAKKGSKIVFGLKNGITKKDLLANLEANTLESCLNYVSVNKGDFVLIPPGTVHALLSGIVVAEIQQNSDVTYRLYDWNRKDKNGLSRELHIDKAFDVINLNFTGKVKKYKTESCNSTSVVNLVKTEFFFVDKIWINSEKLMSTNGESFFAFLCINGNGKIFFNDESYTIKAGMTFLIPANMGAFRLTGKLLLLKAYLA